MKSISDIQAQKKRIYKLYPHHRLSVLVYKIAERYVRNIKKQKVVRDWVSEYSACLYKNGNVRKSCKTQAEYLYDKIYNQKWLKSAYAGIMRVWCVSYTTEKGSGFTLRYKNETEARDKYAEWLVRYPNEKVEIYSEID